MVLHPPSRAALRRGVREPLLHVHHRNERSLYDVKDALLQRIPRLYKKRRDASTLRFFPQPLAIEPILARVSRAIVTTRSRLHVRVQRWEIRLKEEERTHATTSRAHLHQWTIPEGGQDTIPFEDQRVALIHMILDHDFDGRGE